MEEQRVTNVQSEHTEKAVYFGVGGAVLLLLASLLFIYTKPLLSLAIILGLGGIACFVLMLKSISNYKGVRRAAVGCPFCHITNYFVQLPRSDFRCEGCHRMVPVGPTGVLAVQQVRCGYCNALNFYSEKTEVLICEVCDHEIPIAHADGRGGRSIPKGFVLHENDDHLYELVLTSAGKSKENAVQQLQKLLALNRNVVRDMVEHPPQVLLTGIGKLKAEMVSSELESHGVHVETRQLPDAPVTG